MKTIALYLRKGGTGKTSLAVSLAAELARKAPPVILVDLDPQGNASAWIGPEALRAELAGVLLKETDLKQAVIQTGFTGLDIVPTAGLGGQLNLFSETKAQQQPFCIRNLLKTAAELGYRYCVLDLPPAFGALERSALTASDEVITPIMGDAFGVDGLEIFADNLKQVREDMDTEKPAYKRIIVNAIDGRIPKHEKILDEIKTSAPDFHIYAIPVDPVFRKAQTAGLAIQELNGAKPDTKSEIHRLAEDIIKDI
ncbi:MAG: ParA family protein [Treponema sp.]|jgi:chromosome partitioning protein|nr:ParA family protein [Treponema sp.]